VREDALRDLEVVADEVALREIARGEVDLVEIGELNVAAADSHAHEPSDGTCP
jgi:hypothetical protein